MPFFRNNWKVNWKLNYNENVILNQILPHSGKYLPACNCNYCNWINLQCNWYNTAYRTLGLPRITYHLQILSWDLFSDCNILSLHSNYRSAFTSYSYPGHQIHFGKMFGRKISNIASTCTHVSWIGNGLKGGFTGNPVTTFMDLERGVLVQVAPSEAGQSEGCQ